MAARTDSPQPAAPERRPELDAIRMLVVIGLVFFHSALVFATEGDFHVTNSETTEVVTVIAGFGAVWAMPLLYQPIVVAVAYFVVGWSAPIAVAYVVLVTLSLVLTLAAYELLVRRTRVTRFLFGMRV